MNCAVATKLLLLSALFFLEQIALFTKKCTAYIGVGKLMGSLLDFFNIFVGECLYIIEGDKCLL